MKNGNSIPKQTRPPIVAVLGHVDHGKTTLLDSIRKTDIQKREAGGITQRIGASTVTTEDGYEITFIDTPGHAAFTKMRSRGATVADIAILVIAAEEGVKPQTREALGFIREAKIPFIVAVTKIDLPSASVETATSQLEQEGVLFEGRGGDTPLVPLSAKTGEGLKELLEMIALVAQVNEIKGSPENELEAVIIETGKDNKGLLASAVVRDGTIKVGDDIVIGGQELRVRGLFDYLGKSVKEVSPGRAAQIIGFSEPPKVGVKVWKKGQKQPEAQVKADTVKVVGIKEGEIAAVVKAQNMGALEAVLANLPPEVFVVSSSVGEVTQSDVFLAKSSQAYIFSFESKTPNNVRKLAENEGVKIRTFKIIYELFEELEGMIEEGRVHIAGKAEILAEFPYNGKRVAGCKVATGAVSKSDNVTLVRNEKELGKVKILNIKKQKQDVGEVRQGEECGILFVPHLDFAVGDILVAVKR